MNKYGMRVFLYPLVTFLPFLSFFFFSAKVLAQQEAPPEPSIKFLTAEVLKIKNQGATQQTKGRFSWHTQSSFLKINLEEGPLTPLYKRSRVSETHLLKVKLFSKRPILLVEMELNGHAITPPFSEGGITLHFLQQKSQRRQFWKLKENQNSFYEKEATSYEGVLMTGIKKEGESNIYSFEIKVTYFLRYSWNSFHALIHPHSYSLQFRHPLE